MGSKDMSSIRPLARPRRAQAERSAETRQRLLDAAIACLSEVGYAGTTTVSVAARAGLSRGAMLHHFGTRAELLRALGHELLRQSEAMLDAGLARDGDARQWFAQVFHGVLDQLDSPIYLAAAEMLMSGRNDPTMEDYFTDIYLEGLVRGNERVRAMARDAGVEAGPRLEAFLDLMAVTISGAYFQTNVPGGKQRVRIAMEELQAIARTLIPKA